MKTAGQFDSPETITRNRFFELFSVLFVVASFFPYVSPFPLQTDTQPIALLIGVLSFFFFISLNDKFPAYLWMLAVPAIAGLLFAVQAGLTFDAVRNSANYISLFILSMLAYSIFRHGNLDLSRFLPAFAVVWLLIGAVQLVYDKNFATFLLGSVRTTDFRGATGLAPEPTFYATVLLFLIFFLLTLPRPKFPLAVVCATAIVLVAQSAQITLILLAGLATFLAVRAMTFRVRFWMYLVLAAAGVGVYFAFVLLENARILDVLKIVVENPRTLVLVDASANNRASHIIVSVNGFIDNFFLPRGVHSDAWVEYFYEQISIRPDLFWFAFPGAQIMSAYGKALFELGLLSVPIIVAVNGCFLSRTWPDTGLKYSMIVMVNLLLVSSIPLSHPLIPVLIGWLASHQVGAVRPQ